MNYFTNDTKSFRELCDLLPRLNVNGLLVSVDPDNTQDAVVSWYGESHLVPVKKVVSYLSGFSSEVQLNFETRLRVARRNIERLTPVSKYEREHFGRIVFSQQWVVAVRRSIVTRVVPLSGMSGEPEPVDYTDFIVKPFDGVIAVVNAVEDGLSGAITPHESISHGLRFFADTVSGVYNLSEAMDTTLISVSAHPSRPVVFGNHALMRRLNRELKDNSILISPRDITMYDGTRN